MLNNEDIRRTARLYNKVSLWIIAALTLVGLFAVQIAGRDGFINSILFSAVYSLVTSWAYGISWRSVARRSPNMLTRFYMAASAIRMILAFAVVLIMVVALRSDTSVMIKYVGVFAAFYIVMLIFDSVFFARIEKRNKNKE